MYVVNKVTTIDNCGELTRMPPPYSVLANNRQRFISPGSNFDFDGNINFFIQI